MRDNIFIALGIAFIPIGVQWLSGGLTWEGMKADARPLIFSYGAVVIVAFVWAVVRTPHESRNEEDRQHEQHVSELTEAWENVERGYQVDIIRLQEQLDTPKIKAEILSCDLEEIQHEQSFGEIFDKILGDTDTRITLKVRLSNEHRTATIIEHYELKVRSDVPYASETAEAHSLAIDISTPIQFAVPRTGEMVFHVRNRKLRALVKEHCTLTVIDGCGAKSNATYLIP